MRLMVIRRDEEFTIGKVWPFFVMRPSFRNLKPKIGRILTRRYNMPEPIGWKPIPNQPEK
jgi:hypothetical protein